MSESSPGPAPRRIVVIHNPIAGRRRNRRFAATLARLRALGCAVEVVPTGHAGEAELLARRVGAGDCDVLAVAGGDGTINEVVNGLRPDAPPLGVIPLGTANVFAREIGLSLAPAALASVLAWGAPAHIHVATANGRRFVQMAGIGFDARVVAAVDPGLKRRFGKLAYGFEILAQWRRYRPARYRLEVAGEAFEASTVIVAKGRHYAGAFVLDPAADIARPELRVCAFLRGGRWALLRYLAALGTGTLTRRGDVRMVAATSVTVAGENGEGVQLDGDIRCRLPCRIAIAAQPIRVLAGPAPLSPPRAGDSRRRFR
jgi:diacylglycerol kinase (ATP)